MGFVNQELINAFEEHLLEFGDAVTIRHRFPKVSNGTKEKNERGRYVFDEEDIETLARIKLMKGSENIVKNGILQRGDAIGLFSLEDFEYLSANSKVILKQTLPGGGLINTTFEMTKPIVKKTHVETSLKRVDI